MTKYSLPKSFNHLNKLPLVVDLDGTLVMRDTLHDLFADMAKRCPWNFLKIPYWYALGGRPNVKYHLARYLKVDPKKLTFNQDLLALLRQEKSMGRPLILATGANEKIAHDIADHLKLFDVILGSTISVNLTGPRKTKKLIALYGERGYLYAGNAKIDRFVWEKSAGIIVVNPDPGVSECALKLGEQVMSPVFLFSN